MEGEHQEGDVARNGVHVADELSQAEKPKREEEPLEKRATEEVAELLVWPLRQTVEEAVAVAPEGNEEDVGERALAPPPVPESLATEAEEPEGLSDGKRTEPEPVAVEAVQSVAPGIEIEKNEKAPKPPKKKSARRKKTTHKRTDRGRKRPARGRVKKISAKRSAKKRKKSRA